MAKLDRVDLPDQRNAKATDLMEIRMLPDVFMARCPPVYDCVPGRSDQPIWQALRRIWTAMGLDPDNPLKTYLGRGSFAVIKPNWVMHDNCAAHGTDCLVTHSCLIYYMLDWCAKAMGGEGRVVVGDAPIQGCQFDSLLQNTGMNEVAALFRRTHPNIDLSVEDWRLTISGRSKTGWIKGPDRGYRPSPAKNEVNSAAYSELDCGVGSFLEEISECSDRFRIPEYNPKLLHPNHQPGVHKYLIRNEALEADLFINLSKLKTHRKAGLTGALKNLVGVNGHKEYLPHYTKGSYARGGDSYCWDNRFTKWAEDVFDHWWSQEPDLVPFRRWFLKMTYTALRAAARLTGGDRVSPGEWAGNDTVWRTTLDLNHLIYFGEKRPRRILNVVDGIVAGEGEGPLYPEPKPAGVILAGENPAYVDAAIGRLMGYNIFRIPTVYHAIYHRQSKFAGPFLDAAPVCFIGDAGSPRRAYWMDIENLRFVPPRYWQRATLI